MDGAGTLSFNYSVSGGGPAGTKFGSGLAVEAGPGGALSAKGLSKLAPYPDDPQARDLGRLRRGVEADLARLAAPHAGGQPPAVQPPQLLPVSARPRP